ncbi:MAG: hypothetical protein Q4G45_06900 [Actinomycetia bacterium]|mgnify:CR=1 FL=1|nr:hypothetical protein [Actinomycetes bacterium]
MARYDLSRTTLGELLRDPEVVAILDRHAPGLSSNPVLQMASGMPVQQAVAMGGELVSPQTVAAITAEVDQLA